MGDDSQVTINCTGCEPAGYNPPNGYISYNEYFSEPQLLPISKVEKTVAGGSYHLGFSGGDYFSAEEDQVFDNKEDAKKKSVELAEKHNQEEIDRISKKEKNTHTWAWNATYHKGIIRKALKDIEYHIAKLTVADRLKKEEPKKEVKKVEEII